MVKISIIGAGGYVFPLELVKDILSFPTLQDSTISLMDIDPDRLQRNADGIKKMVDFFDLPTKIETTTDRRESLKEADFVICTFQVGGLEAYEYDVEIPREYGIDQTVGDTLGPGGIFRGLRTAVVLEDMAKDMQELCPDALLIQYANPMSINCWISSDFGINTIGFCHSVQGTSKMLADEVGVPYDECSFLCAGINHQAWFIDFKHNNKNILPLIRKTMMENHLVEEKSGEESDELYGGGTEKVRTDIMRLTGYFQTESSHHASEYMAYFRKDQETIDQYIDERWDYFEICSNHDEENVVENFLKRVKENGLEPGHEYGAYVIESYVSNKPRLVHGNVKNNGLISNLPDDCVVEVPITVDSEGLRPQRIGDLPPACAAVNRNSVNQQELAVKAYIERDLDLLYAAVSMDSLTAAQCTLPEIREMVDRMLEAESQWLPEFSAKTFITAD
ncbi:MAG: alpha-galactosidase [Bacillota bacterium]